MQAPRVVADGEWAGWRYFETEPFEHHAGPFYSRREDRGPVGAFRVEPRHLNGGGGVHGGCLAAFADYALFVIAADALAGGGYAVSVDLGLQFVGAGRLGERIEARGEVVRAGGSLVFVRGLMTAGDRPVASFTGVLKKVRPAALPARD